MKKIIFLFLCLFSMILDAQSKNIDSLVNVLQNKKLPAEEQYSVYNDICYYYINSDPQKAMSYIQEALAFAEKKKDEKWISVFNTYTGQIHKIEGNYDMALAYYNKALEIAIDGKIEYQEAYVYLSMATLYHRQGKINTSLDFLMKALSIYEKGETINHRRKEALILYNISVMHRGLDNYDRAISYLNKAEKIANEINDSEMLMSVYYDLGDIFRNKKEYDKALEYISKSLEICRSFGDKMTESADLGELALIYQQGFKDYEKAEKYANEFLGIAKEFGDPYILLNAWNTLSSVYLSQKRYVESEVAAMTAWGIDSTATDMASGITYNIGMANIYLGNHGKAVYYLDKSIEISKQLSDKNLRNLIIDLETKYETEKKATRIAVLEEERKLYSGLGIAVTVALLSVIGLLFYRHRSKRKIVEQQIKQLEQEKKLVAARSALDAEKAEREIIARDLHDGVGAMLSVVKNNMNIMKSYSVIENKETEFFNKVLDGLDKSIVELRRVAHHIMPAVLVEKGLFAALDDFCRSIPEAEFRYSEAAERRFDPEKELVLYRCAYELVNNALRHAGASRIEVHFNIDEETAYLSVVDNGCGFDSQTAPQGMGIKNLRTRLSASGGHMEIYSEEGKGTEANVELGI